MSNENKISDSVIDAYITKLMQENPIKFIQYVLLVIGKEIHATNANEFTFTQESDLAPNERFKIKVVGEIKKVN